MKTKTIFNRLALAMMMPAMLLTSACSSDDAINNENTAKKGSVIPVTVNVTREGDAITRAEYNESTKKLSFSTGDQLFVKGTHLGTAGAFAGTLTWTSGGTFTGTITTTGEYTGTADDLLSTAYMVYTTLVPANYEDYGYFSFIGSGSSTLLKRNEYNAIAASKADAVAQFSNEYTETYTSGTGFALSPQNAILSCTITGLEANANLNVLLSDDKSNVLVNGTVKTDASGNAIFAMGFEPREYLYLDYLAMSVGSHNITISNSHTQTVAGHVYNLLKTVATGPSLIDAFVDGNETIINFSNQVILTSTYNSGSFSAVTVNGNLKDIVTAASMERKENNLVIKVQVYGGQNGTMTINTVNNTYKWSNESVAGYIHELSAITIGGNDITPLPTKE